MSDIKLLDSLIIDVFKCVVRIQFSPLTIDAN